MLRINSKERIIEFVNQKTGKLFVRRENFNIRDENDLTEEINRFLNFLSENKFPVEFKYSGLASHKIIWNIVNQISAFKTNLV